MLKIPNGEHVPHPCKPNFIFHGVGHTHPKGGGDRNPFGIAFQNAEENWKTICPFDTDGDGKTNGEELGDPNCNWDQGELPERTTGITHPGVCDPWDSDGCKLKNFWIDCDPENDFKCDAFSEKGMKNVTIRFPETRVPPTETNYYCMVFDLPQDGDYHIVATTPHIENRYIMHHIVLYGCDESRGSVNSPLNQPQPCEMGDTKCGSIISTWTLGLDGECFHKDVGMRIGTTGFKRGMLQFHWNNPNFKSDYTDSSGMNLFYTPNRRQYDAGVLVLGENYLQIPPRRDRVEVVSTCHGECTQRTMNGTIKITRALDHMHYLGREMKIEHFRNGAKIRDITNDEIYSYDSPVNYYFQNPIEVLPGDELKTTCVFKSSNKIKTTFQGLGTSDEMCYGILIYYPKESMSMPYCFTERSIPSCMIQYYADFPIIENCEWVNMFDSTHPYTRNLIDGITEHCRPFGKCVPDCLDEVKRIQNHPCINSNIGKWMKQFALSREDFDRLKWYAGIDSCTAELALLNQKPCKCKECPTRNFLGGNI